MGNKKRNEDGSKKKSAVRRRKKAGVSTPSGLHRCNVCNVDVPISARSLEDHYSSGKHLNSANIKASLTMFHQHGMDWLPNSRKFFCGKCEVELAASFKTLQKHMWMHAPIPDPVDTPGSPACSPTSPNCSPGGGYSPSAPRLSPSQNQYTRRRTAKMIAMLHKDATVIRDLSISSLWLSEEGVCCSGFEILLRSCSPTSTLTSKTSSGLLSTSRHVAMFL